MTLTKPNAPLFVRVASGTVVADMDTVYPRYLEFMEVKLKDASQEDLEHARRAFTEDLHQLLGGGLHLQLKSMDDKPKKWALKHFPVRRMTTAAAPEKSVPVVYPDWQRFYKSLPGTAAQRLGVV